MIVPQMRLLFWAGCLLVPASIVAVAQPSLSVGALAVGGAFVLISLIDAALAFGRLDGVSVSLPEVVRLTKNRESPIELDIRNEAATAKRLRLGLAFPPEVYSEFEDVVTTLPVGVTHSHVTWPCTGLKRGNHILENVYLETNSTLGFWAVRRTAPTRSTIRVYPNIMRERKNLAALFLNKGMLGLHAQRQVGKGREFEKLREYIPGDSFDDIHWKATAKRNRPITKVFQIERTQEVYVVIDGSRLSARSVEIESETTTQLERFIMAAMILGLVAERQGDLFGVIAFSDHVRAFVRAKNGKAHYGGCRDALYALEPAKVNADFGELFSFIRLRLRRRALLIFLTNLDDPVLAEDFVRNLDVLSRHHLVLVNMLAPPDVAPLFTEDDVEGADDLYRKLGGHIQWHRLRELETVLKRRGVSMSLLSREMMCPQLVSQYINIKRRQLL
ncbi:MAG: DUF58 domain-containing protein [Candidatus Abyssubacteria bacterium]